MWLAISITYIVGVILVSVLVACLQYDTLDSLPEEAFTNSVVALVIGMTWPVILGAGIIVGAISAVALGIGWVSLKVMGKITKTVHKLD